MTFSEAETEINRHAHELTFPGVPRGPSELMPREKVILVAKEFPERSEELWAGVQSGALSPAVYLEGWIRLIETLKNQEFVLALDQKLAELAQV